MNPKFERYLDAKRAGKSVKDCVRAALPDCDEGSPRFAQWVAHAETDYTDIKDVIELEGLNDPKKKAAEAKKVAAEKKAAEDLETKKD